MAYIEVIYKGETLKVDERNAFDLASEIEDRGVTLLSVHELRNQGALRKIASVYSIILNYAGKVVSREDVFKELSQSAYGGSIRDGALSEFASTFESIVTILTWGMDLDKVDNGDSSLSGSGDGAEKKTKAS